MPKDALMATDPCILYLQEAQPIGQFVGQSVGPSFGRSINGSQFRKNREKLIFWTKWYNYSGAPLQDTYKAYTKNP